MHVVWVLDVRHEALNEPTLLFVVSQLSVVSISGPEPLSENFRKDSRSGHTVWKMRKEEGIVEERGGDCWGKEERAES